LVVIAISPRIFSGYDRIMTNAELRLLIYVIGAQPVGSPAIERSREWAFA
jgi:hypothetical protein